MKRDIVIEKLEVTVISLFFSFSVAYFVSLWATASAYAERGYRACGGEYTGRCDGCSCIHVR